MVVFADRPSRMVDSASKPIGRNRCGYANFVTYLRRGRLS